MKNQSKSKKHLIKKKKTANKSQKSKRKEYPKTKLHYVSKSVPIKSSTNMHSFEKSLKQLQDLQSSILSAIPHAVIGLKDRSIFFANEAVERVFGWKPDDIIGKNTRLLYRNDKDYEEIGKRFYPLLERHKTHTEDFPCIRKDGQEIICRISASVIGKKMSEKGIVVIYEDITRFKKVENDLLESEQKYRTVFENTGTAMIIIEKDTTISMANEEVEKISGYSREEIEGKMSWMEFVLEEDIEKMQHYHNLRRIEPETAPRNYEFRLVDKHGNIKQISLTIAMIPGTRKSIGSIIDITERKRDVGIIQARAWLFQFANTHTLDELLEETLNKVEELTDSLIGFYHFVDPDQKSLMLQEWSTRTKKEFCKAKGKGLHYEIAKAGVWTDSVVQRNPVIHNDYASLFHKKGMPPGHAAVVRELVVPVIRGDKITAILGVGNKPRDYDEQDIRTVSLFADLAWDVAERKRAEEELRRVNRALRTISECNQALVRISDEQTLLNEICKIMVTFGGYKSAWIGYAEHNEKKTVRPVAYAGYDEGFLESLNVTWDDTEYGMGPSGTAIRTGKTVILNDISTHSAIAPWRDYALKRGYASAIGLPIIINSDSIGALTICAVEPEAFHNDEVKLLTELANDLAYGISALRTSKERKRSEEALQYHKKLLEETGRIAKVGGWEFDPVSLKGTWTEEVARIHEIDPQMETNAEFGISFYQGESRTKIEKAVKEAIEFGKPYDLELEMITAKGNHKWVRTIGHPVIENGKVVKMRGSFQDITKRKKTEEELRKLKMELEERVLERTAQLEAANETLQSYADEISDLYNNAPCGYHSLDEDGSFISINDTELRWLGYTRDEIVGKKRFEDLITPESLNVFKQNFPIFKKQGWISDLEFDMIRKDGSIFPVLLNATAVKDASGKFLRSRSTLFDITERRKADKALQAALTDLKQGTEELEATNIKLNAVNRELEFRRAEAEDAKLQAESANRAKSDFLANMSHELRTPLNSVIGFSEILQDGLYGELNEKQMEYVSDIRSSGQHLLNLINDILDLSKVESGKMELELGKFQLSDVLNTSMTMLKEKAIKHNIRLDLAIKPDADIEIEADERKLKQIMFNLLSNAVKFTPDGGSVSVQARLLTSQPPDRNFIEISVEDTGIGIKSEEMNKLFKEFSQLETPYEKKYEGTGLGLVLTKKFVELHGGKIRVESEYGKGCKFTFAIPVTQ
jgi:PAS domain S-box-containing protein